MRGITREQRKQQTVRARIGEHEAIRGLAMLAYEIEKRCEVGRKQHWGHSTVLSWSLLYARVRASAPTDHAPSGGVNNLLDNIEGESRQRADLSRCPPMAPQIALTGAPVPLS